MPFQRFEANPIISPNSTLSWQARATFNPAAIFLNDTIHLIYRAQAHDGTSSFGYATTHDGYHIDENLDYPILQPRYSFEFKTKQNWNSGCEDPRIVKIGDRLYLTYTAYDGTNPPQVALTTLSVNDFLQRNWNWSKSIIISPPGNYDKDACILEDNSHFFAFHRRNNGICLEEIYNLDFSNGKYITGDIIAEMRQDKWDNVKIGMGPPPIRTDQGWILFYHALSEPGYQYQMGAMLLDLENPRVVKKRLDHPLLSPEMPYETQGQVQNIVFGTGAVVIDGTIFLYYGAGDTVIGVATMRLDELLQELGIQN